MSFAALQEVSLRAFPQEVLLQLHKRIVSELDFRASAKLIDDKSVRELRRRVNSHRKAKRKVEDWLHHGWLELYPNADGERRFYVYAHVRPRSHIITVRPPDGSEAMVLPGVPFYIGKGCGDRAFKLARNEGHGAQLREIVQTGAGVEPGNVAHIMRSNLTEAEALRLEAQLIYLFGTKFELGIKGTLVNLDVPKRPSGLCL